MINFFSPTPFHPLVFRFAASRIARIDMSAFRESSSTHDAGAIHAHGQTVAIVEPGTLPGFLLPAHPATPRSFCAPHHRQQ